MVLWLIFILWPAAGIFIAFLGAYLLQMRASAKQPQLTRWRKLFDAWNISLPDNELSQAIQDVNRSWNTLVSWGCIGLGVMMTLTGLLRILQVLLTAGSQLSTPILFEQPVLAIQIFSLLIGYGAGYLYGFKQLRKRSSDRLAYGDLRQKRLTDYHSLFLQCFPVCTIIYNCILFLVIMPRWKESIVIRTISGASMTLPGWSIWIIPCLEILLIATTERFLSLIAAFPRILINVNLPLSSRIDNMLRSLISVSILALEYVTFSMLNYILYPLLGLNAKTPDYISYMILVSLLLPNILVLTGIALGLLKGRIGGNLNGWPWQYMNLRSQERTVLEQTIVEKW